MAFVRTKERFRFLAWSPTGKIQSGYDVPQPNSDLTGRVNCTVDIQPNENFQPQLDCTGRDIQHEIVTTRDTVINLTFNNGITPHDLAQLIALQQGVAATPTGSTVNEIQTITKTGTVTGGTFTISLTHEGKTGLTEPIAFDASNATILAALLKKVGSATAMGKLIQSGDVTLGGGIATALTVTFTGRFAATNMAMLVVDGALLTGGGTLPVTQTTAGDQRLHAITRSSDDSCALFSLITGDENEVYPPFKYINCAVNSITIPAQQDVGGLGIVAVTAVIYCTFVTSREAGYTVPACVNITPLRTIDCKHKMDSAFITENVYSTTQTLDSQIPKDVAFGYDDIDTTTAYVKGETPTQQTDMSIYGSPNDAPYQLAEDAATLGNEVEVISYYGQSGNRVSIAGATTKVKFATNRDGFQNTARQNVFNLVLTPHGTPPLTFEARISQSTAFLVASA